MRRKMILAVIWTVLGLSMAVFDFKTGPYFQFSYFFIVPVGLASWYNGRFFSMLLAVSLPSLQCLYFLKAWESAFSATTIALNLAMQFLVFLAFAELIHRLARVRLFRTQMLESLPIGMWVVDRKGRLMHTNPEGLSIWGGNPKVGQGGATGAKMRKHGSDIAMERRERPVWRALLKGESIKNEILDIETPDGGRRVISSSAAPVRDQKGRIQGAVVINEDITKAKRLEKEREDLIHSLEEARKNIKILSGLLPICANCKKIRDDQGAWEQMEQYIHSHSEADFSHGICPDCMRRLYPEYIP